MQEIEVNNLITIIADDHRASAMGFLGREPVRTPALDEMARRGCHFQQLRIEGGRCRAVCVPTRASLITGSSVAHVCADREGRVLLPDAPMLPGILRERGYHCEHIGKWHQDLASLKRGFDHGRLIFTDGFGDPGSLPVRRWEDLDREPLPAATILDEYVSNAFAHEAIDFIKGHVARSPEQPFFLHLALTLPHDPFIPPTGWEEPEVELPLPECFLPSHPFDIGDLDVRDELLMRKPLDPAAVRRMTVRYHALIECIDKLVTAITQTLEERGLTDQTFLLYTGDHGLAGGHHGLVGKQNLYECSVRIPGLLCGPGIPEDKVVTGLASQLDLAPTLLELIGMGEATEAMDGKSLVRAIHGAGYETRHPFHFARYRHFQRMVCDGRFKLIVTRVDGQVALQLFDLLDDPEECRDLAATPENLSVARGLATALNQWLHETFDTDFAPIPLDGIS